MNETNSTCQLLNLNKHTHTHVRARTHAHTHTHTHTHAHSLEGSILLVSTTQCIPDPLCQMIQYCVHNLMCTRPDVSTTRCVHGSPSQMIQCCVHNLMCPRPEVSTTRCVHELMFLRPARGVNIYTITLTLNPNHYPYPTTHRADS